MPINGYGNWVPANDPSLGYMPTGSGGTTPGSSHSESKSTSSSTSGANPIAEQIAQAALKMGGQQYQWAQDQYTRGQALTNEMAAQAHDYASQGRIRMEMGQAESDVARSSDAARQNTEQNLIGMGIDPSSGRYADLERSQQAAAAAAKAGAGNTARSNTEATGRQLLGAASGAQQGLMNTGANMFNSARGFLDTGMRLPANSNSQSNSNSFSNSQQYPPVAGSSNRSGGGGSGALGPSSGPYQADTGYHDSNPYTMPNNDSAWQESGGTPANYTQPNAQSYTVPGGGGGGGGSPSDNGGSYDSYFSDPNGGGGASDSSTWNWDAGGYAAGGAVSGGRNAWRTYHNYNDPEQLTHAAFAHTKRTPGGGFIPTAGHLAAGGLVPGLSNFLSQVNGGPASPPPASAPMSSVAPTTLPSPSVPRPASGGVLPTNHSSGYYEGAGPGPGWDGNASAWAAAAGGAIPSDATTGGFVSQSLSPSAGQQTDDVPAKLNANEFVIPRDVAMWKGQEFFQKLIEKSREARSGAPAKPKRAA